MKMYRSTINLELIKNYIPQLFIVKKKNTPLDVWKRFVVQP
jgi:hypothetical protein